MNGSDQKKANNAQRSERRPQAPKQEPQPNEKHASAGRLLNNGQRRFEQRYGPNFYGTNAFK